MPKRILRSQTMELILFTVCEKSNPMKIRVRKWLLLILKTSRIINNNEPEGSDSLP